MEREETYSLFRKKKKRNDSLHKLFVPNDHIISHERGSRETPPPHRFKTSSVSTQAFPRSPPSILVPSSSDSGFHQVGSSCSRRKRWDRDSCSGDSWKYCESEFCETNHWTYGHYNCMTRCSNTRQNT